MWPVAASMRSANKTKTTTEPSPPRSIHPGLSPGRPGRKRRSLGALPRSQSVTGALENADEEDK